LSFFPHSTYSHINKLVKLEYLQADPCVELKSFIFFVKPSFQHRSSSIIFPQKVEHSVHLANVFYKRVFPVQKATL